MMKRKDGKPIPPGKMINPETGRLINIKFGGRMINPDTGREINIPRDAAFQKRWNDERKRQAKEDAKLEAFFKAQKKKSEKSKKK